jgi:2-oxo-3-hexenedioate decarboxylase
MIMGEMDPKVRQLADELEGAWSRMDLLEGPLTSREGGLPMATAQAVEAELVRRRRAAGHRTAGLKVGFANKAMWRILKLETLIWAHMYDDTVHLTGGAVRRHSLAGRRWPKIEVEIVFKLAKPIGPDPNDAAAILSAVEWVALGFEINDCIYPDWKYQPADLVAAYGLHTALIVGAPRAIAPGDVDALAEFAVTIARNGTVVETGAGKNSLKNPALCVGELAAGLARQSLTPPLKAGDVISTGSLTPAPLIQPGETWTAEADRLGLPPLVAEFV